jgi:hypothetical protein
MPMARARIGMTCASCLRTVDFQVQLYDEEGTQPTGDKKRHLPAILTLHPEFEASMQGHGRLRRRQG